MNQQRNNATGNATAGKYMPPCQRHELGQMKAEPVAVPPKAEDFPELSSRKPSSQPSAPKAMSWASVIAKKESSPPSTKAEIKEEVAKPGPKKLVAKRFGSKTPDTTVKEVNLTPKRLVFTKLTNVAFDEDFDNDEDDDDGEDEDKDY